MSEISPAAKAVTKAALYVSSFDPEDYPNQAQEIAAAALRAAADQVVPLQLPPEVAVDLQRPTVEWHAWNAEQQARFALLAIATELESH